MNFDPNIREIRFALNLSRLDTTQFRSNEDSDNLVGNILSQAAIFATRIFVPLNRIADQVGCQFIDGIVHVPNGFAEAYKQYAAAGWPRLESSETYGGQSIPVTEAVAVAEIFNTANMALTMGMMPIAGAITLLNRFGTPEQKGRLIPRIVSGQATVTMAITESQAGSDVGAIRTKARHSKDGYRIRGQKSLITFGDHHITSDIVHLVLARSPDGPPGLKGLSLYIVTKRVGDREHNDISCISIEKKIGLRGSPTATLVFGEHGEGAHAELLGQENAGLEQMFILMNRARINVAVFGVSSAESALQEASHYAQNRIQGRDSTGSPAAIIFHPDVRRMMMSMRARTEAARYLAYYTASLLDCANTNGSTDVKARLELLTPIAKAWCTEMAFDVTSLGVQIHGGLGYSEESASSQYFREARAHMIYEGTTGIQSNDLIFRKIFRDRGDAAKSFISHMLLDITTAELNAAREIRLAAEELRSGLSRLGELVEWLLTCSPTHDARKLQANGAHFLMFFGSCVACWLSLRAALFANDGANQDVDFTAGKLWKALFMVQQVLPPAAAMANAIRTGYAPILEMKP